MAEAEWEVEKLIANVSPLDMSNSRRQEIVAFIEAVLRRELPEFSLMGSGSSSSRTYLPVSDLDLVLLTTSGEGPAAVMKHILAVFRALCLEVAASDSNSRTTYQPFVIRNVEFVNARTKLVHCLVNNIGVDITINQPGAVLAAAFIEECDRLLGCDHLFKRSLLLIKVRRDSSPDLLLFSSPARALISTHLIEPTTCPLSPFTLFCPQFQCWCIHETHAGHTIINPKGGFLSSYAICTLVLYVFNKLRDLNHPLAVLRAFLYIFSEVVVWSTDVVTLDGVAKISLSGPGGGGSDYRNPNFNQFAALAAQFQRTEASLKSSSSDSLDSTLSSGFAASSSSSSSCSSSSSTAVASATAFPTRAMNIQDPLDCRNNLGFSVARKNVAVFEACLRSGHAQLEANLLRLGHPKVEDLLATRGFCVPNRHGSSSSSSSSGFPFLKQTFPQAHAEYMVPSAVRRDILNHPLQPPVHVPTIPALLAQEALRPAEGGLDSLVGQGLECLRFVRAAKAPRRGEGEGQGQGQGEAQHSLEHAESGSKRPPAEPVVLAVDVDVDVASSVHIASANPLSIPIHVDTVALVPAPALALATVPAPAPTSMAMSPPAGDAHHGYQGQGREEHRSHGGERRDKGDASPESERPSVTRDASSSPFADLELASKCTLMPETADAGMQTDEQFRVVAAPQAIAAPSAVVPPPPIPPTAPPTAQPQPSSSSHHPNPNKKRGPEKSPAIAQHASPPTTTHNFSFSPTMLLVVVGGAVLLTASMVLVVVAISSRLTSPRSGFGVSIPQQQQQQQQQRARTGAAGQASSLSLSQQSTLWLLPNTSVILSPTSPSRFFDATTMTFTSPPIPSHLPIAKEIGQGVRQWWYEWRWEWHLSAGTGGETCHVGALVSSSAKTPAFLLQHREDIADSAFAPAATESTEPLSSSLLFPQPSSSSSSSCLSEDFPGDAYTAVGATASAAPPPLAAWNSTEAALRQLPSMSGTYVAFLRRYKIRHAGGEGAISIPTAAHSSGSASTSDKHTGAHSDQGRFSLLQSIRLSSQPVEMVVPPRTKTKPGYFFKKAGDRLDLVVSATGNPLPEYTWYKNGFSLQRSKEERERPHLLVIDRLSKVTTQLLYF